MNYVCNFQGCGKTADKRLVLLIPKLPMHVEETVTHVRIELGLLACPDHHKLGVRDLIKEEGWSYLTQHAEDKGPVDVDMDNATIALADIIVMDPPAELMLSVGKMSVALDTFDKVNTKETKLAAAKAVLRAATEAARQFRNFPGENGKAIRAEAALGLDTFCKKVDAAVTAILMMNEDPLTVANAQSAINEMADASRVAGLTVQKALIGSKAGN